MNMLAKVQGTKFQVYLLNSDQIKNACLMVFGAMTAKTVMGENGCFDQRKSRTNMQSTINLF